MIAVHWISLIAGIMFVILTLGIYKSYKKNVKNEKVPEKIKGLPLPGSVDYDPDYKCPLCNGSGLKNKIEPNKGVETCPTCGGTGVYA